MTKGKIIELLQIERECVKRNSTGACTKDCGKCELVQEDYELLSMYDEVIAVMKRLYGGE